MNNQESTILAGADRATDADVRTFVTLDGLRGVAALAVLFWHIPGIGVDIVSTGYLAVDLFFMLSGFVLSYRYEDKLRSELSAWRFIEMRVIRLYPLYILGCAIGGAVILLRLLIQHGTSHDYLQWLLAAALSLAMLPNLLGTLVFRFNVPAWSLFYEMAINILFAFVLRHLRTPGLIAIVALSGLAVVWEAFHFGNLRLTGSMPYFLFASVRAVFGFFAGILLYRMRTAGMLPKWPVPPFIPVAMLVLTMFAPGQGQFVPFTSLAIVLLVYPLIMILGFESEPRGALGHAMSWLGILSFPLYALHAPLLSVARNVGEKLSLSETASDLAAVPVILFLAWLAFQYYDKPVRRWVTQRVREREVRRSFSRMGISSESR